MYMYMNVHRLYVSTVHVYMSSDSAASIAQRNRFSSLHITRMSYACHMNVT